MKCLKYRPKLGLGDVFFTGLILFVVLSVCFSVFCFSVIEIRYSKKVLLSSILLFYNLLYILKSQPPYFFFCFVRNEDLSSYSFPHFKMSVNRFEKNRSLNNREENQTEQICRCPRATEQQIIPNWFRSHIFVIQPRVNTLLALVS